MAEKGSEDISWSEESAGYAARHPGSGRMIPVLVRMGRGQRLC